MTCQLQEHTKRLETYSFKLQKFSIKSLINTNIMYVIFGYYFHHINIFHVKAMVVSIQYNLYVFLARSFLWPRPLTLVCLGLCTLFSALPNYDAMGSCKVSIIVRINYKCLFSASILSVGLDLWVGCGHVLAAQTAELPQLMDSRARLGAHFLL